MIVQIERSGHHLASVAGDAPALAQNLGQQAMSVEPANATAELRAVFSIASRASGCARLIQYIRQSLRANTGRQCLKYVAKLMLVWYLDLDPFELALDLVGE